MGSLWLLRCNRVVIRSVMPMCRIPIFFVSNRFAQRRREGVDEHVHGLMRRLFQSFSTHRFEPINPWSVLLLWSHLGADQVRVLFCQTTCAKVLSRHTYSAGKA